MTLPQYYNIILEKYEKGDYKLRVKKGSPKPEINPTDYPHHAINYLIFEYLQDNKDRRWTLLIDHVLIPNGINKGEIDIDFTQVNFDKFFKFMLDTKS